MSKQILEFIVKDNFLLCPKIGFISFYEHSSEKLKAGEIIGELTCYDQAYLLAVPALANVAILEKYGKDITEGYSYEERCFKIEKSDKNDLAVDIQTKAMAKNASKIIAKLDGTIYLRPGPEKDLFIKEGSKIKKGHKLALVEIMKSYYPIFYEGEHEKIIEKVLVKDKSSISSGQELFLLKD